jgi:hypothetical protein
MQHEKIEVKLGKEKSVLSLLGAAAFVAASFSMINYAHHELMPFDSALVIGVGYIGIIFFGVAGIYIFFKLFDSRPGLTIDQSGIYDNSSAAAGHLIKWEIIRGLRVEQVMSTKLILIDIENPEQFMEQASGLKRKLMQGTFRMYGTPVSLSSAGLQCNFDELHELLNERLAVKQQTRG